MDEKLNNLVEEEEALLLEIEQYEGDGITVEAELQYIKKIQQLKAENNRLRDTLLQISDVCEKLEVEKWIK
jgi:predicted nuclease with TOPRIM domain